MTPDNTTPIQVPFSKRVIAVALTGLVAIGLEKVVPGYHPSGEVEALVALAIASAAGWAVREERTYLTKALQALQALGK